MLEAWHGALCAQGGLTLHAQAAQHTWESGHVACDGREHPCGLARAVEYAWESGHVAWASYGREHPCV